MSDSKNAGISETEVVSIQSESSQSDNEKLRVEMDLHPGGAPPAIVMACEAFWRCLGCGSIAAGPAGFKLTRCWCGGESFVEATKGDMLAQQGPHN